MILTGIDLETTGVDENNSEIIEVAWVNWDTEYNAMTSAHSELLLCKAPKVPTEITELTGLDYPFLDEHYSEFDSMFKKLSLDIADCDFLVAHNCEFENKFLTKFMPDFYELPWIDTKYDLPFPPGMKSYNLVGLTAEHGILNQRPHRALFDTLSMMFMLAKYDINEVVKRARSPKLKIRAAVDYDNRDKAKAKGFYWDSANRFWVKDIKECDLQGIQEGCDFAVGVMDMPDA